MSRDAHTRADHSHAVQGGSRVGSNNQFTSVQVLTVGMTYRDIVITGLQAMPRLGEESYGEALHETWGGIGNMTRVCRSLGMSTALATAVGEDEASSRLLHDMAAVGVDTTLTKRHAGWQLPVTVALSLPGDRAMVTVEHPPPSGIAAHLDDARFHADAIIIDMRDPAMAWLEQARADGSKVYASRGFDPSGEWGRAALAEVDTCDAWMLNDLEAGAFTGEDDVAAAARALTSHVPVVVVTHGAQGMYGLDLSTGEEAEVDAFPVVPATTTGAGDSTLAAFVYASHIPGLSLRHRLDVAAFIAARILERPGGAATPPTLSELVSASQGSTDPRVGQIHEILSSTVPA